MLRTHFLHTGVGTKVQTKLARIAEIAKGNPKEQFTSLYHLLNEELLTQCHRELDGNKAIGVDQVTKVAYGENLESNIKNLVERLKRKTSGKKFKAKVKAFKEWLKAERHQDTRELIKTIRAKLVGHYRYYGITDNSRALSVYKYQITKALFKWLNRRSQRRSLTYDKFNLYLKVVSIFLCKMVRVSTGYC